MWCKEDPRVDQSGQENLAFSALLDRGHVSSFPMSNREGTNESTHRPRWPAVSALLSPYASTMRIRARTRARARVHTRLRSTSLTGIFICNKVPCMQTIRIRPGEIGRGIYRGPID